MGQAKIQKAATPSSAGSALEHAPLAA